MHHSYALWIGFHVFVALMLLIDLGVFNRKAHEVKVREAMAWTVVWIALAFVFAGGVYQTMGRERAIEFVTGYLVEKSLSVDNIFVFLVIFTYFRTPAIYQRKILLWGILGALAMRGVMIGVGVALIERFQWLIQVFGAFLLVTGIRLVMEHDKEVEPDKNVALRLLRKAMPVADDYQGERFFIRREGRTFATPLFAVLVVVEMTDLIFALDSIPAILGISRDTFIVYTSNVFAILGLRSLYFALSGVMNLFRFLAHGLALVLIFVGGKMIAAVFYHVPVGISLAVIATILSVSIFLSLMFPHAAPGPPGHPDAAPDAAEEPPERGDGSGI